jgi:transposase
MTKRAIEKKAAAVATAEDIGCMAAANKLKMSKRTVQRYKEQSKKDPALALAVLEARKVQTARINDKLSRLRELATDKMIEALLDPTTPKSIVLATLVQMENQAAAKDIADRILGTDEDTAGPEIIEAEHE